MTDFNQEYCVVLDDHRETAMLLQRGLKVKMLYFTDYDTFTRVDFDERGLKAFFIDVNLDNPVKLGIDCIERLKEQYPMIPIIVITGSYDTEHAQVALKRGAHKIIKKPFNPFEVRDVLDSIILRVG